MKIKKRFGREKQRKRGKEMSTPNIILNEKIFMDNKHKVNVNLTRSRGTHLPVNHSEN